MRLKRFLITFSLLSMLIVIVLFNLSPLVNLGNREGNIAHHKQGIVGKEVHLITVTLDITTDVYNKSSKSQLLHQLRAKNKFSSKLWEERGLNPSDPKKINDMNKVLDDLIDEIIPEIQKGQNKKALRKTFIKHTRGINEYDFDTEELEFLCDWIETLASYVGVDINEELNELLYGEFLANVFKVTNT